MRLLVSFILSVIVYVGILAFLYYIFPKQKKQEKVFVHTAIVAKKAKINKEGKKKKKSTKNKKRSKIKKTVKKVKKQGSRSSVTKGGEDIAFNDIFKNVNYNIDTKKIKQKKQIDMSRLKGIERNLKNIKKLSFEVNFVNNSAEKLSKEEIDDIISQKLYAIWDEVSTMPTDYAKISIQNQNGDVEVTILDTNLEKQRQDELINKIKNTKFEKNFNITVLFRSKVNND